MKYIIGVDGGGTKTVGQIQAIQSTSPTLSIEQTCGGSSLSAHFELSVDRLVALCTALIIKMADKRQTSVESITSSLSVVVGVAGAGDKLTASRCVQKIQSSLNVPDIRVLEDCETALEGALSMARTAEQNVGLISLGTGSFIAMRKNHNTLFLGGWGFPIGDDCSGAKLGFNAVQTYLNQFDNTMLGTDLNLDKLDPLFAFFSTQLGHDKPSILKWLSKAKQHDYAALAPTIFSYASSGSSVAKELIQTLILDFKSILDSSFKAGAKDKNCLIFLTGGIGKALLPHLPDDVSSRIDFIDSPSLLGAIKLASACSTNTNQNIPKTSATLSDDIRTLTTEQRRPESLSLDQVGSREIVAMMNQHNHEIPAVLTTIENEIAQAIDLAVASFKSGGRLIYIGAGTSGRLGVLDAVECPPTFGTESAQIVGLIAGGSSAMYKAVEGAEDNAELGRKDLQALGLTVDDCVVGIAASGRTPYVIGGLKYAQQIGANTISVSNNNDSKIDRYAMVSIAAPVGPEVLSGSTRLGAGTAQKMLLNMISTGSLVQMGKCYENLMVDVSVTNKKLYQRALNIIQQATDCNELTAIKALDKSNKDVKLAILMLKTQADIDTATKTLAAAQGHLRLALTMLNKDE